MMIRKFILVLISVFLALRAQASDKAIIATFYDTVADNHITPVSVEEFAVSGLQSLRNVDANLTISAGRDMIYLYYKRQQAGLWHKPQQENDIKQWAEIAAKIIEKAVKISPKAAAKQEELVEKMFFAATVSLDDHSRYYFADEQDKELESDQIAVRFVDKILYAKIKVFCQNTPIMLKNALNRYPHTTAIIIDLRGNPGGQLNSAIETAKIFIDDGIIVSTKSRDINSTRYYVAHNSSNLNLPLAVLIDKETASSAEMLAAALKEQLQAVVIGTLSYGKGTIQDTYIFDNGGRLALTTSEFFTPSGGKIEKIGVIPDYCIVNDKIVESGKCSAQKRDGREFDVDFAREILNRQRGAQN